ncbi:hypothetical protein HU200_021669 [Digitaria exilis]|uniref:Flavin-containing monooxygenase n=1 Tax=Digitaria exilis TaxID=1010633 RepID=A0A835EZI8_9POAL|nr:hypothetical protein HU200_021669 [Digitaria exilis]
MYAKEKRVAIVGAGPSGLAACKLFPHHDQVVEYLAAYARCFGVMECVRFGCKVLDASYVSGATEPEEVAAWERWSGNGEAGISPSGTAVATASRSICSSSLHLIIYLPHLLQLRRDSGEGAILIPGLRGGFGGGRPARRWPAGETAARAAAVAPPPGRWRMAVGPALAAGAYNDDGGGGRAGSCGWGPRRSSAPTAAGAELRRGPSPPAGAGEGRRQVGRKRGEREGEETYRFDFLILCVGRYGVPKLPTVPRAGSALHGVLSHGTRGRRQAVRHRVAVVGTGKSAMDTAAQCAEANGEFERIIATFLAYHTSSVNSLLCELGLAAGSRSAHWMVDPKVARRVKFFTLTSTRLAELMVHKPGEGFALSLLATILSPLRWLTSKLTEAYFKRSIPMNEHGMVPDCGLGQASLGWRLGILPERFYDMVDDGSIELKKCGSVAFSADGLVLDDGDGERATVAIAAVVVILCTGFDIDRPLRDVFSSSSPWFGDTIVSGSGDDVLPLYRHCAALVGYVESGSSIHHCEMMAKWVAHLLAGDVRLPGVRDMERGVAEWASCGGFFLKSCVASGYGLQPQEEEGRRRLLRKRMTTTVCGRLHYLPPSRAALIFVLVNKACFPSPFRTPLVCGVSFPLFIPIPTHEPHLHRSPPLTAASSPPLTAASSRNLVCASSPPLTAASSQAPCRRLDAGSEHLASTPRTLLIQFPPRHGTGPSIYLVFLHEPDLAKVQEVVVDLALHRSIRCQH